MIFPDPDDLKTPLSSEEFIRTFKDDVIRRTYANIIAPLEPLKHRILATWSPPDGIPDIRFIKNAKASETELRDILRIICLTEGILENCLSAQSKAKDSTAAKELPSTLGKLSVAKFSLMWAYAHEVFHFTRRHALVENHFGSDQATKHALEYDADLCATAAIYRFMQFFSQNSSEIECKRRTLSHIYWLLRQDIDTSTSSPPSGTLTHQHTAARINAIILKLAMLHNAGPADPYGVRSETRTDLNVLISLAIELERKYIGNDAFTTNFGELSPFIAFSMHNFELQFTSKLHKRWDEIAPLIEYFSILPRDKVDNEAIIAFFGDPISMPRKAR